MARKHITQMNADEKAFAHGFIRASVARVTGRNHFEDMRNARHFTLEEARTALAQGTVVEIHNDKGEYRALVRNRVGTCVVLSLETMEAVTVYYNDPSDTHQTLNHNLYHGGKSLDIVRVIKSLRTAR